MFKPCRPDVRWFSCSHVRRLFLAILIPALIAWPQSTTTWAADAQRVGQPPVKVSKSTEGMVVCETEIAAEIGAAVLAEGGNAVDAAVAVAFALAVTWPEAGNIAGGGFMLVSEPNKPVEGLDYREVAPANATVDTYQQGDTRFQAKAVGVPGTVRGLAVAHEKYGKLPWAELVKPSAVLARNGFIVDGDLAASLNYVLSRSTIRKNTGGRYNEFKRVYAPPDGDKWHAGDVMVLPDLADTLDIIADEGADGFYQGVIAADLAKMMAEAGGLITTADLKNYTPRWRDPIRGSFYGYEVITMSPPSSGGICVPQILGMLERLEIHKFARWSPQAVHLIAESMRRSFRDRARYLGDPDFVDIPQHLLEPSHLQKLISTIDPQRPTSSHALAGDITITKESPDTTHFSVIDADGLAVSNTYTLEAIYGSRVIVPGRGILLNNEMGDFNWFPGITNEAGRIGTDANLIAPGKRMLSSMSPTIVRRDGQTVMCIGSPGGRTIINTVSQILVNRLAYGFSLAESIEAPRIHHQWFPDRIQFEPYFESLYPTTVKSLEDMGHTIRIHRTTQGSANCIEVLEDGTLVGVADWRRGAAAAAPVLTATPSE